jgi:hypothetical protein
MVHTANVSYGDKKDKYYLNIKSTEKTGSKSLVSNEQIHADLGMQRHLEKKQE